MTDIRQQLETTLSGTYTLERELGGGGMSRVFMAHELRLGRKVVVKVLSPELAAGISAERFEREIKLAASLQQANIVPVLSAGDAAGLPFYTMPYVEGESLRARLGQPTPLTTTEILRILGDVARALQYAHDRGIVHRDIKPDNVLLSGGTAVVTDFGIAKALAAAKQGQRPEGDSPKDFSAAALTAMGTSIGTPAYMAPEQVAGDPEIDARADIYAFGCLAYELLAGRPPFHGRTPQRVLAAHMGEVPQPIAELRAGLSPALADLVMRCLAKDANDRPQTAAEIARTLDSVTSGGEMGAMPPILLHGPAAFRRALLAYLAAAVSVGIVAKAATIAIGLPDWVFPGALIVMALGLPVVLFTGYVQSVTLRAMTLTPNRPQSTMATLALKASPHLSWRRAAAGGGWAFGGFAALVAAFMALRALGIGPFGSLLAAGKLGAQPLIIAEFKSTGPDTTLGAVVSEAVRADLAQSSAITLLSQQRVNAALQRTQRGAGAHLDMAAARDVAAREGVKAIVDGEVRPLGAGFLVTVRLVGADSGDELASFRRTADTPKELIATIGELSRDLRGRIGESLKHMQQTPPLEQVATASLPALRKYTQGKAASNAGDVSHAITYFEEAAAIDTSFASAYRALAIQLGNLGGNRDKQFLYMQKAYDHRDRLPEAERYLTVGSYFGSGPHVDGAKAIEAYRQLLELDPRNLTALNNIAVQYVEAHDAQRALEYTRRLVAVDSSASLFFANLFRMEAGVGNWAAAESAYAKGRRLFPTGTNTLAMELSSALHRGRRDSVAIVADRALAANAGNPVAVELAQRFAADVERSRGHLAEATRRARIAAEAAVERGAPAASLTEAINEAFIDAWDRERRDVALARADSALARWPLASLAANDRPYFELGMINVLAGRTDRARAMATEFERASSGSGDEQQQAHTLRSLIASAEHRADDAIAEAKQAQIGRCYSCSMPVLARAYDLAGKSDSAIAVFTRFVDDPWTHGRETAEGWYLAGTYKRLGELWEAKGDREKAASYYAKFVDLWKTADPELQPRVAEVKRRLARLGDSERR